MILSKIKKHLSIFLIRLNQNKELKRILKEDNKSLSLVIHSFLELKSPRKRNHYSKIFEKCEDYRQSLLEDAALISYDIFGSQKKKSVSEICKKASSQPIWAQFLFLLVRKTDSPNVLEIGTNLGVSGSYILSALRNKKDSKFITMEGLSSLCKIANTHFESLNTGVYYEVIEGLYKHTLPIILNKKIKFNIFFIDGNHNKKDTLSYFNSLKSIMSFPAIIIFDDINWSIDMQSLWKAVTEDKDVSYAIDFFKLGVLIIDDSIKTSSPIFKLHIAY
tara:strand:+ start:28 stop:855 length:828 start_codon:yes stop_codon:yes gene_type:complete